MAGDSLSCLSYLLCQFLQFCFFFSKLCFCFAYSLAIILNNLHIRLSNKDTECKFRYTKDN